MSDSAASNEQLAEHTMGTAEEALSTLLAGNARFVAGTSQHGHQEIARRAKLEAG